MAVALCAWVHPSFAIEYADPSDARHARSDRSSDPTPADDVSPADYLARDADVTHVFDALAASMRRPLVASTLAQRKRVSGRFDLTHPERVLDRLCADLGLVSYFDGHIIYVYDMSELRRAVGSLKWIDVGRLRAFLLDTGMASTAFPIRGESASRTFYVAGPPAYVESVLAAAQHLDHGEIQTGRPENAVKVVPLKHSFVRDRVFKLRGQTVTVPGVATVLAEMLGERPERVDASSVAAGDRDATGATQMSESIRRPTDPIGTADDAQGADRRGAARRSDVERLASSARDVAALDGRADPEGSDTTLPPLPMGFAAVSRPRAIRVSARPSVLAYPDTNSLLIKGSEDDVAYLSRLIEELDVEKTQIELSLWIIDIDRATLEALGIQWQASFGGGGLGVSFNGGGGFSTLDGARFLASVFALSRRGEAQIVSRPLILTQENVPALFDNNRTFYAKLVGERTSDLQSITYGTLVSVIPRLSVDHADIEMILEIEDGKTVDAGNDGDLIDGLPVVGRTHISTIARVPRAMSLLIGGYTRHEVNRSESKVPLLGDIPWLGGLFRVRHSSTSDLTRVFLIQPRVLTGREIWQPQTLGRDALLSPGLSVDAAASTLRDITYSDEAGRRPPERDSAAVSGDAPATDAVNRSAP
ncbi:type III secretion system outer membrane ring subunit SctC [Pararobbsia silviterrae]|uniref:type III secretion system outer membrane ring subunit SctC n=1 Tax=Pararobbsia silviterrae TaxID=1792498 RepID=UPI001981370C|nr:type III secretion system outer membrane ring subunit SctC [Pararobbsia silviterrae]